VLYEFRIAVASLAAGVLGAERMTADELFSLRVLLVGRPGEDQELLRQALSSAPLPIEVDAAESAASAVNCLSRGADLVYVDGGLAAAEIAQTVAAARRASNSPLTVQLTVQESGAEPFGADGLAAKPVQPDDAKRLVERSIRMRLPSRVLVVDDSATMRSIVRKLLAGTRFPLDVTEADEGFAALKLARESEFDLVFLDYNMPGFSGLETLAEFRREKRRVNVVLMTSMPDDTLGDRARDQGAAFLKKPFFPADIEAVLCRFYGLLALNPNRA
jgi:CheY-like chemotaxis protein